MSRMMFAAAILIGVVMVFVFARLAFIEVGREVVTLRTPRPDGGWSERRLWVVDYDGSTWLHSGGEGWLARFEGDPVVELERANETLRFVAHAVPGPHPVIDQLIRNKYGWVDGWVRLISRDHDETVVVRLDPE